MRPYRLWMPGFGPGGRGSNTPKKSKGDESPRGAIFI